VLGLLVDWQILFCATEGTENSELFLCELCILCGKFLNLSVNQVEDVTVSSPQTRWDVYRVRP